MASLSNADALTGFLALWDKVPVLVTTKPLQSHSSQWLYPAEQSYCSAMWDMGQ